MILRHITSAFFGSILFFTILTFGQNVIPTTIFMGVDYWERSHSYITGEIVGYKIRDCTIVKGSFVGWEKEGSDPWHEVPFEFIEDTTPDSSAPFNFERQSFRLWRWHTAPRHGKLVKMTMQHNCGGKVRTTSNGPFKFERG